jgi:hypothetical protein
MRDLRTMLFCCSLARSLRKHGKPADEVARVVSFASRIRPWERMA